MRSSELEFELSTAGSNRVNLYGHCSVEFAWKFGDAEAKLVCGLAEYYLVFLSKLKKRVIT